MWLPDWLYKSLPLIYALCGMFSIYSADNVVGYGAGGLLVLTAFLIFKLRTGNTAKRRKHRGRNPRSAQLRH
jgi:hypothetical protein